jgi:alkyl hydroperoxide reductase subunit AhpF
MPTIPSTARVYDTLIIGGGPGGLTAAIYLERFMRKVALFDKGNSRLSMIPLSHNYPGVPEGVRGPELLDNLRCQLGRYGGDVRALTVLLATGIADTGLRSKAGVPPSPPAPCACARYATATTSSY